MISRPLMGTARGISIQPNGITGLILWLKSDTQTWQDSAFTTAAAANNDPVGGWRDQSGGGYDATGSGTARPLLKTSVINGYPSIFYDGVNDVLTGAFFTLKPASMFVVGRIPDAVSIDVLIGNAGNGLGFDIVNTDLRLLRTNVSAIGTAVGAMTANAWFLAEATYSGAGAYEVLLNSVSKASGTNNLTISSVAYDIASAPGGYWARGDIVEVVMYDNVISASNRQGLETYFNQRYGIW